MRAELGVFRCPSVGPKRGGDGLYMIPIPINRLKSIGNLRTRTIVRVWHRAEKSPRLARAIWFGAGAGGLC